MIVFKVKIRSIVDRPGVNPFCSTLRLRYMCQKLVTDLIQQNRIANTFPGIDRSDMPVYFFAVFRTALSLVNRENNSLLPIG